MTRKSSTVSKKPLEELSDEEQRRKHKEDWRHYFFNVLTSITIDLVKLIPVALVALFTIINRRFFFATFQQFWLPVGLTYALTIAAVLVVVKILRFNIPVHLHSLYEGKGIWQRSLLSLALLGSLITPVALVATITPFFYSHQSSSSYEAQRLFPQAADIGPVLIRTHASNGEAYYSFFEDTPLFGPNSYVRITLRNYGTTEEQSSGWVYFFLRGADLGRYKALRFLIRGETGSEKIGITAKDSRGIEMGLILNDGPYLTNKSLTTEWQEATIPFTHFGNVDFSLVDNFGFFTRGDIAQTIPQTFYVGGFRLIP